MNIRQAQYLIAVYEEGSISGAAIVLANFIPLPISPSPP